MADFDQNSPKIKIKIQNERGKTEMRSEMVKNRDGVQNYTEEEGMRRSELLFTAGK